MQEEKESSANEKTNCCAFCVRALQNFYPSPFLLLVYGYLECLDLITVTGEVRGVVRVLTVVYGCDKGRERSEEHSVDDQVDHVKPQSVGLPASKTRSTRYYNTLFT